MNDYEVEIYGHAGAGKTILLASLYNALSNMRESGKEEISNLYQSAELADKTRDLIAFNKFPGPTEKTDNPVQFLTFRLTVKGKPINLRISAHAGEEHRDKETKAIREEVADKSKKLLVVVVNPFLHNADLAWKAFRNLIAVLLQDEQLLSFQEACYAASYILFQVTEESLDDNYLKHVGVEATFQPLEGVRLKYDHHEPDIEKRFTLDNASDEATQSLEKLKELVTRIVQGEQGDRDRLINLVKGLENSMVVLSHIDLVDLLPCIEQADFDYVCNVLFNWEPNRSYRQQLLAHNIRLKIGSHHKEDIFPVQVLINSAQQFYRNVRSFAIEAKFKPLPDRATDGKFKPLPDRAILKWPVILFMVAVLLVTGICLYRLSVPTIPVEPEPKKIGIEERIIDHPYDEVTRLAIRTAIWQMIVHNENKDNQQLRIALFLDLVSQEKKRQLQLLADEYLAKDAEKDMMAFTSSLAELVDTYQSFDEAKVGKTSFFTFVNSLADDLLNEENSAKSLKGIDKDVDKFLKDLDTFSNSQKDAKSTVENAKSKLAEAEKLPAKNAQRAEKVNNAKKELENANKSLSVFDKTLTSKEENVRIALWKVVSQSLPEKDILKAVAEASEENEPQKLLRSYIDDVLLTQLKLDKLNKTELKELGSVFVEFAFAPELGSYPPYGVKKLEAWLADKNIAESMSRLIDSELETLIDKDWNKVLGYLSDTIDLNSMEKEKQEILKRSIILQWIMAFNADEIRQLYLAMVW